MSKPFTTGEAKKVIEMWVSDESIKEICKKTGRKEFSIRGLIRRQRDILGPKDVPYASERGWTSEMDIKMIELWNAGDTVRRIAKKLNKTPDEIYARIGIDRRKYGEKNFPKRKQKK